MRATDLLALAAACGLTACGQSSADASPADDDGMIDCAVGGSDSFHRDCSVERNVLDGTLFLTVRHPDGGFRRFEVVTDGRGLVTADGARRATVVAGEGRIDVTVDVDRYRFPATIADAGA